MPDSWRWDKARRRYLDPRGRAVTDAEMHDLIDQITMRAGDEIEALSQDLIAGRISSADWQIAMLDQIKQGNRAMALLAFGGAALMGASQWGQIGALIREQNSYFQRFAAGVDAGEVTLGAELIARARLYASALYGVYAQMVRRREQAAGAVLARRVLDAGAEHCEDCPAWASEEFQPIEDVPPIGTSQCMVRCRCHIEYATSEESDEKP